MFYDIQDPSKFCKDIENLLTKRYLDIRVIVFSFIDKKFNLRSNIHEHIAYYDLNTINDILEKIS